MPNDDTAYAASVWFSVGNCDTAVCSWPQRDSEIADFEYKMVGGPGLNPGPHGPELWDNPSRNCVNDRFQFGSFGAAACSLQI